MHFNSVDLHDHSLYRYIGSHSHQDWAGKLYFWILRSGMVNLCTLLYPTFLLPQANIWAHILCHMIIKSFSPPPLHTNLAKLSDQFPATIEASKTQSC